MIGRKSSEDTKERIRIVVTEQWKNGIYDKEVARQRMIKLLEEGKIGWTNKESYPEKFYREFLESLGYIKNCCFFQNFPVGRYRLDFAFPEDMRCIEIDGSQHLEAKSIAHDRIRDEWLETQGWNIVRIPVVNEFYLMIKSFKSLS